MNQSMLVPTLEMAQTQIYTRIKPGSMNSVILYLPFLSTWAEQRVRTKRLRSQPHGATGPGTSLAHRESSPAPSSHLTWS